MNEFCKRLKELRLERGLTQTEVANALGVTTQAVSKWESQTSLPDIVMLIPIADFYGVTADYLLGHDTSKKEQEILDYLRRHETVACISGKNQYEEAIVDTRNMLRKHPMEHRIMLNLCLELLLYYVKYSKESKYLIELLEWGDIIIDQSTNSEIRYQAIDLEIAAYCHLEMYDKARNLVDTLPEFSRSKDALIGDCYPRNSKERLCAEQTLAYKCLIQLCNSMLNYGEDICSQFYTNQEKLEICQTLAEVIKAYHSNDDYDGFTNEYLFRTELYSALYAAIDSDTQQAIVFLKNAQCVFVKFDTISATVLQRPYTTPFLRELSAPLGCRKKDYQKLFRMVISQNAFDALRDDKDFKEITQKVLND